MSMPLSTDFLRNYCLEIAAEVDRQLGTNDLGRINPNKVSLDETLKTIAIIAKLYVLVVIVIIESDPLEHNIIPTAALIFSLNWSNCSAVGRAAFELASKGAIIGGYGAKGIAYPRRSPQRFYSW
jgi:hypothetical protein